MMYVGYTTELVHVYDNDQFVSEKRTTHHYWKIDDVVIKAFEDRKTGYNFIQSELPRHLISGENMNLPKKFWLRTQPNIYRLMGSDTLIAVRIIN